MIACVFAGLITGSCDSNSCDPIDCRSSVSVRFARTMSGPYSIEVEVGAAHVAAQCPGRVDNGEVVLNCDDSGFVLTAASLDAVVVIKRMLVGNLEQSGSVTTREIGREGGASCLTACIMREGTFQNQ
jgi:hypothetical protein